MQGPKSSNTTGGTTRTVATPGTEGRPQAAQSELLVEISRLLHDLNQPLSAITNYAQAGSHLCAGGASPEQLASLFDKIAEQSRRAADISQELRKVRDRDLPEQPC